MRNLIIAPALALALAVAGGAGFAFASDDEIGPRMNVPKSEWMSRAQLADILGSKGYNIREIEVEHGAYEVSVYGKDGRRSEIYVHPATGDILPGKPRDD